MTEECDRHQAVTESLRVLKAGGLLVLGFISSYAHGFDVLNKDPSSLGPDSGLAEWCRSSQVYLESQGRHFADGYVIEPFEVEEMMNAFPADKLAVIGAEGLFARSERSICKHEEQVLENWTGLCKEVADTPEALAAFIHVTYFGRKRQ